MLAGYMSVSSLDQNPERQLEELSALRVAKLFRDKLSGKSLERPDFRKMLRILREQDALVVPSLACNLSDLFTRVQDLTGRKVSVRFLTEKLDVDAVKEVSLVMSEQVQEFRSLMNMGVPLSKAVKTIDIGRTTAYNYLNARDLREGSAP